MKLVGLIACFSLVTALTPTQISNALSWSFQKTMNTYNLVAQDLEPARVDAADRTGLWRLYNDHFDTAGYFPGILAEFFLISNSPPINASFSTSGAWQSVGWAAMATQNMQRIAADPKQQPSYVGFIYPPSFGMAVFALPQPSPSSISDLLQAAQSLASRYVPGAGVFRSWDPVPPWSSQSQVIVLIDNLITLELLFMASQLQTSQSYIDMAISHATQTALNHIRPDGSTVQQTVLSASSGKVLAYKTFQGQSDTSCWTRGQAWAIAGFTMVYRFTQLPSMLQAAQRCADYYLNALALTSNDFVPPYDFQALTNLNPKDSSAAAIAASSLLELDVYSPGKLYRSAAASILSSLISSYTSQSQTVTQYQSILINASANVPGGSYNGGLIYGDFHFVRALRRYLVGAPWPTTTTSSPSPSPSPSPSKVKPPPKPRKPRSS